MPEVWVPLESNPDVIQTYCKSLGLKEDSNLQFTDVMSTEDWALEMVPRPVHALLMVFPIKDATEARSQQQKENILANGQTVASDIYYMKQTVPNACGTVAILHAIGNLSRERFTSSIDQGSFLQRFFTETKDTAEPMAPDAIASVLEEDKTIDELHGEAGQMGQSEVPNVDEVVTNHFVCFSMVGGHVYELDGRKEFPINHGSAESILGAAAPSGTNDNRLLEAAIKVCKDEFMSRDPDEVRFTFIALTDAEANA